MDNILDGRLALITGAGRGIGRAIAIQLAQVGARVVLVARSTRQLGEVAAAITAANSTVHTIAANLGAPDEILRVITALVSLGDVEVLINNAATVAPLGPTVELDPAAFTAALNLNVVAPATLTARLLPAMIRNGWGRVVNISSGIVGHPGAMIGGNVYDTSKAALEAHTLNLAAELDGTGVTVNMDRPGSVDTAMQEWVRSQDPGVIGCALHALFSRNHAEGKLITPEYSADSLLSRLIEGETGGIWTVTDGG